MHNASLDKCDIAEAYQNDATANAYRQSLRWSNEILECVTLFWPGSEYVVTTNPKPSFTCLALTIFALNSCHFTYHRFF